MGESILTLATLSTGIRRLNCQVAEADTGDDCKSEQFLRWKETVEESGVHGDEVLIRKTFHELELEAQRIKKGSQFTTFEEFDFALDCWSVLNRRSHQKIKSKGDCRVRRCRYGATMRTRKAGSSQVAPAIEGAETAQPSEKRQRVSKYGAAGEQQRYLSAGRVFKRGGSGENLLEGEISSESRKCDWRVRVQKQAKTGTIEISVCVLEHQCPADLHGWRGASSKSMWLAKVMCKMVENSNVPIRQLMDDFLMLFHKSSRYKQIWRAQDHVKELLQGSQAAILGTEDLDQEQRRTGHGSKQCGICHEYGHNKRTCPQRQKAIAE
ncbi:hypothetical protein R1sor_004154 [Riccia sorocarpa]|uniref:Transposase n=1 Tax=Riccia sorocarpa TaxID=122646 RepID=A0ABD3H3P5_9MARC